MVAPTNSNSAIDENKMPVETTTQGNATVSTVAQNALQDIPTFGNALSVFADNNFGYHATFPTTGAASSQPSAIPIAPASAIIVPTFIYERPSVPNASAAEDDMERDPSYEAVVDGFPRNRVNTGMVERNTVAASSQPSANPTVPTSAIISVPASANPTVPDDLEEWERDPSYEPVWYGDVPRNPNMDRGQSEPSGGVRADDRADSTPTMSPREPSDAGTDGRISPRERTDSSDLSSNEDSDWPS